MKHWLRLAPIILIAAPAFAAEPAALEQALLGRRIMIPFDLPVSSHGVDFDGDRGFARDDKSRIRRLEMWGMSLRGGDLATITEIRVSKRSIELLLDRGGLSTTELMRLQDPNFKVGGAATQAEDTGPHSTHSETREAQRERVMISGELGGVAEDRARDAQIDRAVADTTGRGLSKIAPSPYKYRPGLGSRLRILFKKQVPAELLEPRALMLALSEHVMFVRESTDVVPQPAAAGSPPEPGTP